MATIRTDVPLSIDIVDLAREQSHITYTPKLVEFLKQYEFRSLLPNHHEGNHTPFILQKTPQTIDSTIIETLIYRIKNNEPYTFYTSGEKELQSFSISFSGDESYI